MPDITMCSGDNCPLKEKCYRYTANPNDLRQSYFMESPYKNDGCEHFLDVSEYRLDEDS